MGTHEFDVGIIGGGLAGSALARQLLMAQPELRIGVFERQADGGYKVGESTVEVAANYLARRLDLNAYLFENHLLKHGLRFFFDSEGQDLDLAHMSEIGTDGYPFHPSFQVDRARLDADLRAMNLESGVDVRIGVSVQGIRVDDAGGPHRFDLVAGDQTTPARARWLVDASGRARVLGKALGWGRVDIGYPLTSVWGRFRGIRDIDGLGPDPWRARVRNTARHLSTNHFCYPGYWIWVIPLRNGVVSIGVVGPGKPVTTDLRKPDALRAFLASHPAVAQLIEGSEIVDTMGSSNLSYGAKRFFSEHRFGFTGESAAFGDPFYSPGSDIIATENDLLADLIRRDFEGEGEGERRKRTELYDRFMHYRIENALAIYKDLYPVLGSFELMKVKYAFDVSTYYNIWVDAYLRDLHRDEEWLSEQLRAREPTLIALRNLSRMFREVGERLRADGRYYRGNHGGYFVGQDPIHFNREVGRPRTRKAVMKRLQSSFNDAREGALALLGDPRARDYQPQPLYEFMVERSLLDESSAGMA